MDDKPAQGSLNIRQQLYNKCRRCGRVGAPGVSLWPDDERPPEYKEARFYCFFCFADLLERECGRLDIVQGEQEKA